MTKASPKGLARTQRAFPRALAKGWSWGRRLGATAARHLPLPRRGSPRGAPAPPGLGLLQDLWGEAGDALGLHLGEGEAGVHEEPGEEGELVGGVYPLHVQGGVGLGVAQALGLKKRLGVGPALLHLLEDVEGGAVQDAVELQKLASPQGLQEGEGGVPAMTLASW